MMKTNSHERPKVVVIGLGGQSAFMSTESFPYPGETVSCSSLFFEPGGKGYNQAIACARMGVQTVFVGAVGNDLNAEECKHVLEREGVIPCLVKKDIPTAYAVITTDHSGENTVQVFGGAAKHLDPDDLYQEDIAYHIKSCDYLLLQNELSSQCLTACIQFANNQHVPVILNPAPAGNIPVSLLSQCYLITPNLLEATQIFDLNTEKAQFTIVTLRQKLPSLLSEFGIRNAIVTLGNQGSLLIQDNCAERIPPFSCGKVIDTTGAGDTFTGTLTGALALGKNLRDAAQIASIAAGISVTKHGAAASIPLPHELKKHLTLLQEENNL